MESQTPTLKEVTESANLLVTEVSHHVAIERDEKKFKTPNNDNEEVAMDIVQEDRSDDIQTANKLVSEIDNQVKIMYKAIHSKYSQRFPELRVSDPLQYIITAHLLGNKPDRISNEDIKDQLTEFLEPKTYLLISMSAATTQGIKIEPDEMQEIMKACSVAIHLGNLKVKLLAFVEKNMASIAPNLSVILGASIAAKLLGLAGGLDNLACMPACNVAALGSSRVSRIESDESANPARVGFIYDCDLIQKIPFDHTKDVRKRAVKWVANKCSLAARCDLAQPDPEGKSGRAFRDDIIKAINRDLEPPPKKAPRPLPAPIEKSGKKRGGKRVRRMKERYQTTELRKAANRINFGDVGDDAYQNNLEFGRSQLNAIQKLRGPQINDKTKIRLSKSAQKKLEKQNRAAQINASKQASDGSSKTDSKTVATSIDLKPEQQLLVISNPSAAESYKDNPTEGTSSYFSDTMEFSGINYTDGT